MKTKLVSELTEKISQAIPGNFDDFKTDTKQHIKTMLEATFEKFELVTREDFDIQAAQLAKCQEKLRSLEVALATLEEKLGQ